MNELSEEEAFAITHGANFVVVPGEPALADDPRKWRRLWTLHGEAITVGWISEHPGTRPQAWHTFDAPALGQRFEGERDIDFLERFNAIDDKENEGIKAVAVELVKYNAPRRPDQPRTNFIVDSDGIVAYALRHSLITELDVPTLEAERWKYDLP
jgi:hypothetical protein